MRPLEEILVDIKEVKELLIEEGKNNGIHTEEYSILLSDLEDLVDECEFSELHE